MTLPESKILEKLNAVSTAKRLANMELHDSAFGKREDIHRVKAAKREKAEAKAAAAMMPTVTATEPGESLIEHS